MKKMIALLAITVLLSGCSNPREAMKQVIGVSTKDIEDTRADGVAKVFNYDYKTCYDKAEALLKKMDKVSIYAKTPDMIAVYVVDPDTTPVGLFFTKVDDTHTQVEISSPASPVRDWVAKNIYAETLQKQETVKVNF